MAGHHFISYSSVDALAFALQRQSRTPARITSHSATILRTINADADIVGCALRLLDALAPTGPAGMLARVRRVAAGDVRLQILGSRAGDRTSRNHHRGGEP